MSLIQSCTLCPFDSIVHVYVKLLKVIVKTESEWLPRFVTSNDGLELELEVCPLFQLYKNSIQLLFLKVVFLLNWSPHLE